MNDLRDLISRCLDSHQDAMIELVDRYRNRVFGLCYRMLGQRQDAEDATQETFIRVLRNLARWDPTRDFEPWLLAIAGNRCRTVLATRQRRPVMQPLDQPVEDRTPDFLAARTLDEEVRLAILHLRPEFRQAFVLFHDHGQSYVEIGNSLQCPVGTAKTWVYRARQEVIRRLLARGVVRESEHELRRFRTSTA